MMNLPLYRQKAEDLMYLYARIVQFNDLAFRIMNMSMDVFQAIVTPRTMPSLIGNVQHLAFSVVPFSS